MLGIIGGSGVYDLPVTDVTTFSEFDYQRFGPPSALPRVGKLGGYPVAFIPRFGKNHTIHPHRVNYEGNLYALKAAGCKAVISTGAVGSLSIMVKPGDLFIPTQFARRSSRITSLYKRHNDPVVHVAMAQPTWHELDLLLWIAAQDVNVKYVGKPVHLTKNNTYVCIDGPQFSTVADSALHVEMFGESFWSGRDRTAVVGMTVMHEASIARELELGFSSLCLVTDFDSFRIAEPEKTASVSVIQDTMSKGVSYLEKVLLALVQRPELVTFMQDIPPYVAKAAETACMSKNCYRDELGVWTYEKLVTEH